MSDEDQFGGNSSGLAVPLVPDDRKEELLKFSCKILGSVAGWNRKVRLVGSR